MWVVLRESQGCTTCVSNLPNGVEWHANLQG